MDQDIDIQCYSETNLNTLDPSVRKSLFDKTTKMDRTSKGVWSSSDVPKIGYFKPGGTSIVTRGKSSSRVKETGTDNLGRWCYQVLDGKGDRDVLLVSIYQSCKTSNKDGILTAHHQQKMLLGEMGRKDIDPRRNFKRDLTQFIKSHLKRNKHMVPMIIGDWNEECKGTSTSMFMCDEFGLVNVFERMYPNHPPFKTYRRGSSTIDFVLAPPDIADKVTNFVYEPFLY